MRFIYCIVVLVALAAHNAHANLYISDYCSVNVDCSANFKQAVRDANQTKQTIWIDQNIKLNYVNLEHENVSYLNLNSIPGKNGMPVINAGTLNFKNINEVIFTGLKIDGMGLTQLGFLVALDNAKTKVTVTNSSFNNSDVDLLNIAHSKNVNIRNSSFFNTCKTKDCYHSSGVSKGNGLIVSNSSVGNIENNSFKDIWQVAIFLKEKTFNFTVSHNTIDTVEDNGIRLQSDHTGSWFDVSDITISDNTISGVNIDAIRANGKNIHIVNNKIDGRDGFTTTTTVGIKAEGLIDSTISGNNIIHSFAGIGLFSRYAMIDNVTINNNKVEYTSRGFYANAEAHTGFAMNNLLIHHNEFYNTYSQAGIPAWVIEIFGNDNAYTRNVNFHSNTITNRQKNNKFEHYVVRLKNLENPDFGNNYIDGTPPYSYLQTINLNLADIKSNSFISRHGNYFGWGGIRLDSSNNILIRNNNFSNVCPKVLAVNGSTYSDINNGAACQ